MQKNSDTRNVKSPAWDWGVMIGAAVLVAADEFLKWTALQRFPTDQELVNPSWFALAVHKNIGVAFDIPFRLPVVLVLSLIISAFLLHLVWKEWQHRRTVAVSALVTLLGAAGNFFDRVAYGFTVDYLLLFGRSAMNLSDLLILAGIVGVLFFGRKSRQSLSTPDALTE